MSRRTTGSSKINLAKFSDTCSVRADPADALCIGSPRLVGGRRAGNSNMQKNFPPRCTSLAIRTRESYYVQDSAKMLRQGCMNAAGKLRQK